MSGYEGTCVIPFIKKDMFANFSQIRNLSLSYCELKSIEKGAFENLLYLEHLDVSNNQGLTLDAIPNITYNIHREIESLNFAKLQCTFGTTKVIKKEHVKYLSNTTLKSLNIAANRIAYADDGVTKLLPTTLRYINAGDNSLSYSRYVFELSYLKGLEILNISYQARSHQKFNDFFKKCKDEHLPTTQSFRTDLSFKEEHSENFSPEFPWIFDLDRDYNFTIYFPPNLKVIYIDHSHYTTYNNISIIVKNNVTHFFSRNNLYVKLLHPLFGLQTLEHVDLSQNLLTNISGMRKNDCKNLKFLNLSFNMLGNSFEDKRNGEIFEYLHRLEVLDLSTNRLTGLADGVFDFLTNIRYLNVSFNKLEEWNVDMSQMKHLVSLDLSNNGISVLSKLTMDALDFSALSNTVSVNLRGNPLMCTCDNLQFLNWLSQQGSSCLHFPHREEYRCVFSNSSSAKIGNISMFVHQMTIECTYYPFITLGCVFFLLVFLGITSWKILHRYRWTLRYWYYVSRSTPKRYKSMENFHFRYDAFISYDEEDSEVALQLVRSLETKKQLNCCVPERDFMPGTNIAENIINAVHVSKKFLCILSGNYVDSYWPMFEFHMGQMDALHSKYRKNKDIFVVLSMKDTFQVDCLNATFLSFLQSDSCVTYSHTKDAQFVCVEKLSDLIGCENYSSL
jgi:Leucine-rich repeat (LRR) protein